MRYVYWFIIAGLVWNCVWGEIAARKYRSTIARLRLELKFATDDRDKMFTEYQDLKAKIVDKATPKVVAHIPKRYTGAQLRVLNDKLNAQATADMQERPNSEILREQA